MRYLLCLKLNWKPLFSNAEMLFVVTYLCL
nr:MAG TPA: hypothetical protein [Caudoviricetes sp.]